MKISDFFITKNLFNILKLKDNKGFSLIEVLFAVGIISIALLGLVGIQGIFATQTVDRTLQNSLIDAASSALIHCQNVNTQPPSAYTYENNMVVNVSLNGSCSPAPDACNNVTATAAAKGRTFALTTFVCNFQ